MSKKNQLDLFGTLKKINLKKHNIYSSLSEEERKHFHPLVVMRWLSGINNPRQIMFINELANPLIFNLSHHPGLLTNIFTCCTTGKNVRYQWIKCTNSKKNKYPLTIKVLREYFGYSSVQAKEVLPILSNEEIEEIASDLGWQKEEIRDLKKELKNRAL